VTSTPASTAVDDGALFCVTDEKTPATDILVVDDVPRHLRRLRAALSAPGYRVTTVCSGKATLRLSERPNDFAVIVMDATGSNPGAYEAVRQIRQNASLQRIPVILLTDPGKKPPRNLSVRGPGLVDYLYRPVDMAMLRAKVAIFVEFFRKNREMERWGAKLDEWINERAAHR
jgi:CheY-like chemotaxis protein